LLGFEKLADSGYYLSCEELADRDITSAVRSWQTGI
jgi:hypothetical protein